MIICTNLNPKDTDWIDSKLRTAIITVSIQPPPNLDNPEKAIKEIVLVDATELMALSEWRGLKIAWDGRNWKIKKIFCGQLGIKNPFELEIELDPD
jgi:hypothetical protein